MGRFTYGSPTVHNYNDSTAQTIRIGAFCSIADDVEFLPGGNHRTDTVTTFPLRNLLAAGTDYDMSENKGNVDVGNDVWIGRGARIVGAVKIGNGAVVAAYSVVVKDVAAYSIVAGHPAQHRRFRLDEALIPALERIAWWDWNDEMIQAKADEIRSDDVAGFVARYGARG